MENMQKMMDQAEQYLIHTYNRHNIVLDKGEGMYLYDTEGKKYLDFGAGIAVFALGYGNKELNDALKKQIDKLVHTSNLFYNSNLADAAKKVTEASGMDKVFFTNSGTEAIEGAIKIARKYAYQKGITKDSEIISMDHSFHGRSLGALAVTGNKKYQEPFGPMTAGIKFAEYNNLENVKSQITSKTCAIIMETVQGEGGIYPATDEFIHGVRALCDEHDILMISDEIQCGMGRTGSMYAYQSYGIQPDIVTTAKALGCGVPVGAFMANKKASGVLVPGDHGTTYGGNPLVLAAVNKVFDLYKKENIIEHVNEMTPYLEEKMDALVKKYDFIKERRGKGFMQGLEFNVPVAPVIGKAIEKGLILVGAGANIIRFVPPLIAEKAHVDEMIQKLEASFGVID